MSGAAAQGRRRPAADCSIAAWMGFVRRPPVVMARRPPGRRWRQDFERRRAGRHGEPQRADPGTLGFSCAAGPCMAQRGVQPALQHERARSVAASPPRSPASSIAPSSSGPRSRLAGDADRCAYRPLRPHQLTRSSAASSLVLLGSVRRVRTDRVRRMTLKRLRRRRSSAVCADGRRGALYSSVVQAVASPAAFTCRLRRCLRRTGW